jgi:HEAT repeat protein
MSESVLKEIFPYFTEKTTKISRDNLKSLRKSNCTTVTTNTLKPEVIDRLVSEITDKKSVNRADLLETVLFSSENEVIKKSVIQELIRLKSANLHEVLKKYLKDNKENTPSKLEAIRALGKVAIQRYMIRK